MASEGLSQSPGTKRITTFYPTMEEFKNFSRYVAYIESQGAHRAGLAKIVPPKEWTPRGSYEDIDDLVIPAPIQQVVTGQSGLFTQYNIQKKSMTVREFRKIANSDKFCCPRYDDFEELERKYWKNVTFNPPIYGADVNGSLYKPGVKEWNICHLNTILDTVENDSGITIEGVNTPYLYFGMWKTTFAWHTEDMDLYSVNYLHFGEPKSWYCIPPEHGKRFERLAKGFFPGSAQNCEAFLRHKMTLISPSILKKYGIPFDKVTQEAGEFMITFPYGYHAGFNHGFNCAESTNFATERWIEYGKQAVLCSCRKDMVKISMDVFVKKFQPERYSQWLAGKDVVPIDHSRPTPEAREFLGESFPAISSKKGSGTTEISLEEEERNGLPQRIETKRHRVCLEVPDEVVPKEEDDDEVEYGKRPRINLMPPKNVQDIRRSKGPPKLVVTPTKLALSPFHRGLNMSPLGQHHSSYMKINVPPIGCHTQTQNGHQPAAVRSNSALQPSRKMGVASLLFHRTKSPQDAIQVQSYASEKPQTQQHTPLQLQVHSYAREHQPQNVPYKVPGLSPMQRYGRTLPTKVAQSEGVESSPEDKMPVSSLSCSTPATSEGTEINSGHNYRAWSPKSSTRKVVEEQSYCKSVLAKKQQKNVLCQLPRHHPLFREDEEEIDLDVDLHWEEKEDWAKPLFQMWQCRPYDPMQEQDYNRTMGEQSPYCSICLLFYIHHQNECENGIPSVTLVNRPGGHWSKPLIPEMCFHSHSKEEQLPNPRVEEDGTSRLVSCSQCSVRVHTSCYGVSGDEDDLDDWLCARCEADATDEDCCLCSLRGGALQRANSGKWVHVLCAIAVKEARFVNISERSPIDISSIPVSRFKLKCVFCRKRMKREVKGCCVQCSQGRCTTAFHPTCAMAAGVLMNPDDWPLVVYITCHRHKAPTTLQRNDSSGELTVGQRVIAKYKNGRYYHSEVQELSTVTFYEVLFDDGSYSDNLFPEDIENRDCVRLGPPAKGATVEVRWTDGLIYGAKFQASHSILMYMVEFEDGSQISLKREDIYTLNEDLPKRVKSRMSVASDMRFELFTQKEVQQNSKRQRVVNSRYREDYIEPVIYRAIME